MTNYRKILEMHSLGFSQRSIESRVHSSHQTVKAALDRAVEACTDMKQENWLMCHVHAYEYFGGVTRVLVPDNLKTGVTSNTRYETQLNESYRELAEYYGTAIVPARVRKPQDKGLVEKSVGFSTTWITAALRERKFFSFAEVRNAVAERLEVINTNNAVEE